MDSISLEIADFKVFYPVPITYVDDSGKTRTEQKEYFDI